MRVLPVLLLFLVIAGGVAVRALGAGAGHAPAVARVAPPAELPTGAIRILAAHPFVLDEPYVHEWRAEKPAVRAGYLLALEVAPELARARQTYEPVLYVGSQTAERCNAPMEGGSLIVLVPAELGAEGGVALDLATTPIWFGSLELPERVDATRIVAELELARRAGIGPAPRAPGVEAAATPIRARTRWELEAYVQDLIARFSVR